MLKEKFCNVRFVCFFVMLLVLAYESSAEKAPFEHFVYVENVIPSIILDIRYYTNYNFVGEKIEGYSAPQCILTKEAAYALYNVQIELNGLSMGLKVYDCYRPQRAVNHFIRWVNDKKDAKMRKEFFPTMNKDQLFKRGFLAYKSSHSRGSTVDVTLVRFPISQQEKYVPLQKLNECSLYKQERFADNSLDMGTGFDCFHERARTINNHITTKQQSNRLLLKSIMEKYGFKNYAKEWWHFTLKDEPFPDTYFDFVIE